jgi:hypothetical protein
MPEGFNDKNKTLIAKDANGTGGSAVCIRFAERWRANQRF